MKLVRKAPRTFVCFWCRGEYPRVPQVFYTRDHLRPVCLGRDDSPENLRDCCHACNLSRGMVPSNHGNGRRICRKLAQKSKRKRWKAIARRYVKRLPAMLALWERWCALERERLGYAPSEPFRPEVPVAEVTND